MTNFQADFEDTKNFEYSFRRLKIKSVVEREFRESLEQEFITLITEKVKQKGLVGKFPDEGDGPALSSRRAWEVQRNGPMNYTIKTDPMVGPRAFWLEYGTGPTIEPKGDGPLRFRTAVPIPEEGAQVGDYIYRSFVNGVREYRFFREAVQEFDNIVVDVVEERLAEEVSDHIRNQLSIT